MASPGRFISSPTKRREMDLMKLYDVYSYATLFELTLLCTRMMSDYEVVMEGDSANEFYVKFPGPKDSMLIV